MAVAGFAKTDIEVSLQGNKLTIEGSTSEEDTNETQDYIFKGIANRNFTRTFNLADKIEIKDAEIANGMLKIWLENIVKAQDAVKKIAVKSKDE
jgi:molecular chaperone IbpA